MDDNLEEERAERRRQVRSTWTREELLRWDEQRRNREEEHRLDREERVTQDEQEEEQRLADEEAMATNADTEPARRVDWGEIATAVRGGGPLTVPEYTEVLDLLNTVVPLSVSTVRVEAGVRRGAARAHVRPEAQRARVQQQARFDEMTRARARTEFARVALARSTGVNEIIEAQAMLRARERVEEILAAQLGLPASLVQGEVAAGNDSTETGLRVPREKALGLDELYVGRARPADLTTEERVHQLCAICRQVKSHPVSYRCGHSHCYVCIRMWLEYSWKCPECVTVMHEAPVRHYPEENGIALDFPSRAGETQVRYSWAGLTFPERAKADNVDESA
ncbi:hypothetical protein C8R47DRAFT_1231407 [Mycena vitilis]|nr:hypothetical protein C8R47DRAFT_1231407 [Mycena vitilis]